MMILISPAKTFARPKATQAIYPTSTPHFARESEAIVRATLALDRDYLAKQLRLSDRKAEEAYRNWRAFISDGTEARPALSMYAGMVFKKLGGDSLSESDWAWADEHLLICSFVYGLLRPSDGIKAYRMEGTADLAWERGESVFAYWRDRLTPWLIEQVRATGGVLFFLGSEEMKQLFHWDEVERSVRVITPRFMVRGTSGQLKQIVIYTKMARGVMARHIIEQRITDASLLRGFRPEGFTFTPSESSQDDWCYVLEQ